MNLAVQFARNGDGPMFQGMEPTYIPFVRDLSTLAISAVAHSSLRNSGLSTHSARKVRRSQRVDATLSNQLIHKCLS
jgi:hypothetical protein